MNRRWLLKRTNAEYVSYLSRAASISPVLAQILITRGIKTPEGVYAFFSQTSEGMSDPFEMGGVEAAVGIIESCKSRGTKVLVHGDYDADGLTATAIMVEALRRSGLDVRYHIPNRFQEGYGLNPSAVKKARGMGVGLVVTVDCGIASFEAAGLAKKEGVGLIITDHHEPALDPRTGLPKLPEALAVINPKLSSPGLAALSGAGVALKMAQALASRNSRIQALEFMDLAALGTLADSVPLVGENRVIVREGIRLIEEGRRTGITALKAVSGMGSREIKAGGLSYTLVPRINAAGRLSDASEVVDLLLSPSEDTAMPIAEALDRKNSERQQIEEEVLSSALALLEKKGYGSAVVLAGEGWHEGVIGIVASRIAEKFYRPSFVFNIRGDTAKGSARSIPEFDVYAGLTECREVLLAFGGHRQAAGLSIRASGLGAFEELINEAVGKKVRDFVPSLRIDADIGLRDISFRLVKELALLEPYGFGNAEPVLGSRGLEVIAPRVVGNNHLKMRLQSRSKVMDAIGFEMGALCETMENSPIVDAAYVATVNEWEGGKSLQLNLKGLRPASPSQ
jgi:single-stranded-DNA-specific exonuclease